MTTAEITLNDSQIDALHRLSEMTGKAENDLLQEAFNMLIREVSEAEISRQKRDDALSQAAGIWKDRTDLPDFEKLRKEWDRDLFGVISE